MITLVVEKKDKLNEQNFDGEANWSGVVNFHCMQRSLEVSMLMRREVPINGFLIRQICRKVFENFKLIFYVRLRLLTVYK